MVRLLVKRGDQAQFLHETSCCECVSDVVSAVNDIFNARLKLLRLCGEVDQLCQYGVHLPPHMLGLTAEQLVELKLTDEWADTCHPSGGHCVNVDPTGRRNGRAPSADMQTVLKKTVAEAKAIVCASQATCGVVLSRQMIDEALSLLRGAVMIVYPMNLPPHDPVAMELDNREQLDGTQAAREIIDPSLAQLWFSGKQMIAENKLSEHVGTNEKTRVVVKLQKKGEGAPCREPVMSSEQQKQLMLAEYRRREELKKLDQDQDNSHLNSNWADSGALKRAFHGLDNVSWRPS